MEFKLALRTYRDWLRSFCEENRNSLTHGNYEELWQMIEGLDHDLGKD